VTIAQKIIEISKNYVGQTEISGNKGFLKKSFQAKIQACG
jgi:hypothetical protein